ncbi:hypothetical protein BDR07DRAFT_1388347 [Suillus spraguei]|nr:hypothetical protein BDR07DRAFT_1388347 [Suillus spraguei]
MDVVRTDEPRNPLNFPATLPLPRSLVNRDGNVSADRHNYILHLRSSSLDPRQHHSPPNPPSSILPRLSLVDPVYIDHQPGGPFKQFMHRLLSSMFLLRRVNCGTLQRVLSAMMMIA